jgi:hypothetical protein
MEVAAQMLAVGRVVVYKLHIARRCVGHKLEMIGGR